MRGKNRKILDKVATCILDSENEIGETSESISKKLKGIDQKSVGNAVCSLFLSPTFLKSISKDRIGMFNHFKVKDGHQLDKELFIKQCKDDLRSLRKTKENEGGVVKKEASNVKRKIENAKTKDISDAIKNAVSNVGTENFNEISFEFVLGVTIKIKKIQNLKIN